MISHMTFYSSFKRHYKYTDLDKAIVNNHYCIPTELIIFSKHFDFFNPIENQKDDIVNFINRYKNIIFISFHSSNFLRSES